MTTPTREDLARIEAKLDTLLAVLCPKTTVADELRMVEVQGGDKVAHLKKKFRREKRK